jgi:hypothetical protein
VPGSGISNGGFEYLVPNPEDHGYTLIYGELSCATAISAPLGLKVTPCAVPAGNVAGFEYLVPKPDDHGYTLIYGELSYPTAISALLGLKATEYAAARAVGNVAGFEYLVPKPDDHG